MVIDSFLSTEKSFLRSKLPNGYKTESGIKYRGSDAEKKNIAISEYLKQDNTKSEIQELIAILDNYNKEKNEAKLTSLDYYDLDVTADIHIKATLGANSYSELSQVINNETFKNPKYDIYITHYNEDGFIDQLSIVKKINGVNNRTLNLNYYSNEYEYFEDINKFSIGEVSIYNLSSLIISIIIIVGAIVVAISIDEDENKKYKSKKSKKEFERELDSNTNLSFKINVDDDDYSYLNEEQENLKSEDLEENDNEKENTAKIEKVTSEIKNKKKKNGRK